MPISLTKRSLRPAAPETHDEAHHVARAKDGDRAAFSQLVRMHQAVVRAYLGAHARDAGAADDLAQEVFLRAFRRLDAFQLPENGTIRPWLLGIARNLLLEYRRGAGKLEARGRPESLLDAGLLQAGPRDPMEIERRIQALQGCLEKLAPAAARLVWRHYFERSTLASLAAEECRQESALRMRLLRIREALRVCIEQTMGEGAS